MRIFLSYRRADSQVTAGRMAQFLDNVSAVDGVFLDVDAIGIGEHVEDRIEATLAKSTHVFVLIGPQWKGSPGDSGRPRIFDTDDIVRREVRIALRSGLRVVPILLDEARMPRAGELPDDLNELSKINAFSLRTAQFDEDMDNLLDVLIGNRQGRGSRWRLAPLTAAGIALRAFAGLAAGAVLLLALAVANRYVADECYDLTCTIRKTFGIAAEADALGLLLLLVAGVLVLSALVPFVPRLLRRRR